MGSEQPEVDIGREVRFAIVMYGGVSLAIYINGVAQELYRMVRATAVASDDATKPLLSSAELRGTKRVYRNLGKRSHPGAVGGPDDAEGPIRTRFVVDVLSGTSAGGINAVYLAKALANNQKFDALKRLWIEEGDVQRLINDKEAAERAGIEAQKPPRSLLSSIFMYRNLFDALQSMDGEEAGGKTARYSLVDELDLFVTVTDVVGLPLTLRLLDKPVSEKRYRNVLRFRYDGGRTGRPLNNFRKEYNPLLAFAARATSAFPFAFEPMELAEADDILREPIAQEVRWKEFFPAYGGPLGSPSGYEARAFVDGGYLDNKPFGYAIDTLASRRSGVTVERKLL
jgi:patatin-related protein